MTGKQALRRLINADKHERETWDIYDQGRLDGAAPGQAQAWGAAAKELMRAAEEYRAIFGDDTAYYTLTKLANVPAGKE